MHLFYNTIQQQQMPSPPRAVRRTREELERELESMLHPSPAELIPHPPRAVRPPLPMPAQQIYANIRHEYRSIRRRMDSVAAAIDQINDEYLSDLDRELHRYPNKKLDIEPLQHLYILEITQKREELMRLRDRIVELKNMLRTMHIQYEIPYVEGSRFPYDFGGGASTKTKTRRHKWSLKYKRSIDCNHPKGFSQKQHCKYSRNKFTK